MDKRMYFRNCFKLQTTDKFKLIFFISPRYFHPPKESSSSRPSQTYTRKISAPGRLGGDGIDLVEDARV